MRRELYGLTFNEQVDVILADGHAELDAARDRAVFGIAYHRQAGTMDVLNKITRDSMREYAREYAGWKNNAFFYTVTKPSSGL